MTAAQHTRGPWKACTHLESLEKDAACKCGYRGGIWSTSADVLICEIGYGNYQGNDLAPISDRATQLADARLIAAAPDLLAAMQPLADEAFRNMRGGRQDLIDDACRAIAKATGGAA